jgi:HK97 family phage prohead protease
VPSQNPSSHDKPMRGARAAVLSRSSGISSWDPETREFEFVLASETPCRAYRWTDWDRGIEVDEVLSMEGLSNLESLAGVPILRDHGWWSIDNRVGVIVSARIEGSTLVCRGRLSDRPEVSGIASDVASGILNDFSVGFEIEAETTTERTNQKPLVTVTGWRVLEASIVAVPADPTAKTRSRKKADKRSADPAQPAEDTTAEQLAAVDAALTAFSEAEQALEAAQTTLNDARAAAGLDVEDEPDAGTEESDDKDKPEADAARAAQIAAFRSIVVKRSHATAEEFDALVTSGADVTELRTVVLASMTSRSRDVDSTPPATTDAPASTGLRSIRANIAARAAAKN